MNYKTILTTICAVLLVISAPAKDKVFDRPAFRSSSESDIYPVKVELTKKATIVHFRVVCAKWREWSINGAQLVRRQNVCLPERTHLDTRRNYGAERRISRIFTPIQ